MRNYLKIICLALSVILVAGALGSCHGKLRRSVPNETVETPLYQLPSELDSTRNFEISFWAKNDTNLTQVAIYQKAVSDFEALYPNIKVNLKLYTDYGKIYNDVITNIATGTTPNVCITYPDHIATYKTGEQVVVPLDGLMDDPKFGLGGSEVRFDSPGKDEVVGKFLEECKIDGTYYALPYMRSTEACYVNKTYVEKLGFTLPEVLTWDFMWEVAEAATAKDADGNFTVNGQKVLIPIIYKSTDNMMIQMLAQKGAGYSGEDGEVLIFNETTEEILKTVAEHTASGAFSTFKISSYPANFLNAGQCIFAIDSTGGATWMGSEAPLVDISEDKLVSFETAVMTVPQYDPENIKMISQGPSMCIFDREDKQEVLAAWLFAQFMLTDEVQIAYASTEGYAPVTLKAQNSAEYTDYLSREGEDGDMYYDVKLKATKLLLDNMDNTFVTPVFNGSTSLRDASGQLIENVTKSVRRKEKVDDAYFDKLYENISSLYHLDEIGTRDKGKLEFGKMPSASVALVVTLVGVWGIMGAYFGVNAIKKAKKQKN